jgi:Xaa-Pro aminopeptidase
MNFVLKGENSIYYEAGYSSDNAIFLQLGSEKFFITDSRYTEETKASVNAGVEVIESSNLNKTLRELLRKFRVQSLIYDPLEWSFNDFISVSKRVNTYFKKKESFSKWRRIVKTREEIETIQRAVNLGRDGIHRFQKSLTPGKSEKRMHFDLQMELRDYGNLDLSFDPIVAINSNASKPHSLPTEETLSDGDLLLIDAGVKYNRYCSDRTETFAFNGTFSNEVQKIYDTVQKAHDLAIEKARSGMRASDIDKIARDVITEAGYGDRFIHSTGHGVGLDIHEFPNINSRNSLTIEDGMIFTVEPGIYIPGFIGVRIEDMVVMESGKAKVL